MTLNEVEISLKGGKGSLMGLVIENPEGYHAATAFEIDEVTLELDLGTVTSDEIGCGRLPDVRVPTQPAGGIRSFCTVRFSAGAKAGHNRRRWRGGWPSSPA